MLEGAPIGIVGASPPIFYLVGLMGDPWRFQLVWETCSFHKF